MEEARALFHDPTCMRFAVVTIPTVMAAAESARLAGSLRAEGIPINTMVVNQVGWGGTVGVGVGGDYVYMCRIGSAKLMGRRVRTQCKGRALEPSVR